ncbi:rhomboid family intramembrane serine protease [Rosettibacter firmus]|uniref:rhomboid family intramembrane serine protease n=1 Tax=Rosettibacter firmus TaxID=3111522 RepID=UPI00336C291E
MIPLKDDIPSKTFPIINITLIITNVVMFLFELMLGSDLQLFIEQYGVIPVRYFYQGMQLETGEIIYFSDFSRIFPLFTSMFLHGGWVHLFGNMLYLWIFGDNVEDRMGHFRYLIFYILCGLAASFSHIIMNPESSIPTIGASGAIAGVLGAYMFLYPDAKVVVLLPIFIFFDIIQLPALFVLGLWFVMQLFQGTLALSVESSATGGVAWWAHIGGFVFGAVTVHIFKKKSRKPMYRDEWWLSYRNF